MVLSGLKTHLPVLAVSETGSFDFNTNLPGITDWIANAKASIRYSKDNYASNLRELSTLWQTATGKAQSFGNATTITHKSRGNIDCSDEQLRELSQLMQDFRNELQSQGYEVMDIHQTSEYGYTPEMSEVFLRRAKEAIYPLYEEYYEDLCFVVHITGTADGQGPGRLINTSWGQAAGFNRYFPLVGGTLPKAGCGPVALGQIMNYHKFPAEYEWNTMHPIYSTTESARLLYDIACNANYTVENGGAKTSVYTLCRALDKMGYNAKAINHNFEKVMIELTNQRPVLIAGFDPDDENQITSKSKIGHAWLCTGYATYHAWDYYVCYTFTGRKMIDEIERSDIKEYGNSVVYYNWGWHGEHDGAYYDDFCSPGDYNFSKNRLNIIEIYPVNQ